MHPDQHSASVPSTSSINSASWRSDAALRNALSHELAATFNANDQHKMSGFARDIAEHIAKHTPSNILLDNDKREFLVNAFGSLAEKDPEHIKTVFAAVESDATKTIPNLISQEQSEYEQIIVRGNQIRQLEKQRLLDARNNSGSWTSAITNLGQNWKNADSETKMSAGINFLIAGLSAFSAYSQAQHVKQHHITVNPEDGSAKQEEKINWNAATWTALETVFAGVFTYVGIKQLQSGRGGF